MFTIQELEDVPVIRIENFLTNEMISKFYTLLEDYNKYFTIPNWTTDDNKLLNSTDKKKSLCSGKDIWFPTQSNEGNDAKIFVPKLIYELIENYMFHQGIMEFCTRSNWSVFRLLPNQTPDGRLHIITYGDGDYYSWHKDQSLGEGPFIYGNSPSRNNLFTFSMNFCSNDEMEGGDLLFMHNNKTIMVPFKHNTLAIFPATLYHSATKIKMNAEDTWLNRRISCQFWLAGSQSLPPQERLNTKWEE